MTFSIASSRSFCVISTACRRAASSAASFRTFARSAPEKPAVAAAIRRKSTSEAKCLFFEWTLSIASRPERSGASTITWRSNRPGRSRARSRTSGRLVAARSITPMLGSNPSISTSNAFKVCSRSSLTAADMHAALPADGIQFINENDAGGMAFGLLKQIAHPCRADADEHFHKIAPAD